MAYTYTPTYYSSLHDSITSICKNILPFSFKKRRLPAIAAAEQLRAKQQSDNLKWQQESFHQIHNLMGLCKEGILHEDEVSAFRTHLLETLIASPVDYEQPVVLRDKLIFLQELFYAECISEDEYHASKRPLLQRLAVQGAEIGERDVIVQGPQKLLPNEACSAVDLKEDKCLVNSESFITENKPKDDQTPKKIKGPSFVLAFVSPDKHEKLKEDKNLSNVLLSSTENPFWNGLLNEKETESKSILMLESFPEERQSGSKKGERKPFDDQSIDNKEKGKSAKRIWGFDGFKVWKKSRSEDEKAPLSLGEKSDDASYIGPVSVKTNQEQSDCKKLKKKLRPHGSPADFFVDEAFGENVKNEVSRIQTELGARSRHVYLSEDQVEEVSTQNQIDDAELKKSFQKKANARSWCDENGDNVFNDHIGEREISRGTAMENHNSKRWTTFDDEENSHPNLFAPQDNSYSMKQVTLSSSRVAWTSFNSSSIDKGFKYNPFFDM